ncbi:16S rRNA (cytosine(1402)-N(4))-methyltransferase [Candidatus Falkowbacteria bacterium RIFOXYB2_FULL_47_14]|uniref:Ribosomal RNA small subunit methyltransferase H n=1 Tax=Candidatus Falkowbacteria bacterium RIFOXYA2_FULL_47_19 TaxID=1797994 RepID=A0A1F5SMZ4_9BACT|nr:MAG: 16S rRNA (cytosine(1402)-N(4))-methyltransferase [Candidatus Falkowbacteria bacterium RIFOXYA2_FULL_47_19]OGF36264.1 MAG: 16S rRNA (cytosine(1402)-N(4))-methyltransferase [Candidatus Falkowbacteria bacterium RIFOXYC2_FULL_46_15]OGF43068.1 MAG: 16S rRNA (cytosine(1402)-N(4))-methyltransferase [Candidatus Falkowbacteria bacterium RIFOXYB2_FULL_47_14]
MKYIHVPVMLGEVLEYLDPKPGEKFMDCTLGGGGYTAALAERVGKKGLVAAFDLDNLAIEHARKRFEKNNNIKIIHGNFKDLHKIMAAGESAEIAARADSEIPEVPVFSGIVFDLGLSSAQLEDRRRGFSFQLDAPLDMAFGQRTENAKRTTEYIVNRYPASELARILREYGEERFAGRIARAIVQARKEGEIKSTGELVNIIGGSVPAVYRHNKKIHFATRAFQALRIATNDELGNLENALPQAVRILKRGGRIAVVSYHSLEDRIVKNFFKTESRNCVCPAEIPVCQCGHKAVLKIITKKTVLPAAEEVAANPRARSAKMRVAEKI